MCVHIIYPSFELRDEIEFTSPLNFILLTLFLFVENIVNVFFMFEHLY